MKEYPKIQTVFMRNKSLKGFPIIEGAWTLPEFEYLSQNIWTFTEKVDGTNIRIGYDGALLIKGRTDASQLPTQLEGILNNRFNSLLPKLEERFPEGVIFFGEGYGVKIQKGGGNYRADQEFVLFDIQIGKWWLRRQDIEEIAKEFGMDVVPIVGEGTLETMVRLVKTRPNSSWGPFQMEGIVARPKIDLQLRNGQRVITKLKCNDFEKV